MLFCENSSESQCFWPFFMIQNAFVSDGDLEC